jgi:hypothetical protein
MCAHIYAKERLGRELAPFAGDLPRSYRDSPESKDRWGMVSRDLKDAGCERQATPVLLLSIPM